MATSNYNSPNYFNKHSFYKSLFPSDEKGRFRKDLLHRVWRFAAGMSITGILGITLLQIDKIILSRMLNLEDFGYYTLAITISAMTISMIVTSVTNVIYPKFSSLVALGNETNLSNYYHFSCQLMSFFLIPTISILAFYSYPIILIWTRNSNLSEHTYLLLTFVVIGAGLNGLIMLPYHLQLAHSWTRLGIYLLAISIITIIPLMLLGITYYGVYGGIFGWIIYNLIYGLTMVFVMHKRILIGEHWRWFFQDIVPPILVSITLNSIIYYFANSYFLTSTLIWQIVFLGIVSLATFLLTALSLKTIREFVVNKLSSYAK